MPYLCLFPPKIFLSFKAGARNGVFINLILINSPSHGLHMTSHFITVHLETCQDMSTPTMGRLQFDIILLSISLSQDPIPIAAPTHWPINTGDILRKVEGLFRCLSLLQVQTVTSKQVWCHRAVQARLVPAAGLHIFARCVSSTVGHLIIGRHRGSCGMRPVAAALVGGPQIAGAIVVAATIGPAHGLRRRRAVCGVVGLEALGHPTSLRRIKLMEEAAAANRQFKSSQEEKTKMDP